MIFSRCLEAGENGGDGVGNGLDADVNDFVGERFVEGAAFLDASLPEITNGLKNNTSSSTSSYVDLRFEGKIFYK